MKINGSDGKVWLGMWAAVWVGTVLTLAAVRSGESRLPTIRNTGPMRVLHGAASLAIIAVFPFPHLGHYALGIFGNDVHVAVM